MWKTDFHHQGQSLIGIIIVLVVVGLITGGLYYYLSKQIPEIPGITKKPAEEVVPKEEIIPPKEEVPPEEIKPEVPCQNECSPTGSKRCFNSGYQICGNYDIDACLEWSSIIACPKNTICQNGNCIQQKCADGTLYGQCSANKPKYCEDGALVDKASLCGCPTGYKIYKDQCKKIVSPPAYEPIIFALNKGYADRLPNWKQQANKVIDDINSVFKKTTQKQFKIDKYLTYNDSEYTNLFTLPENYPQYYQDVGDRGGITFILLVHKDGISNQELKQLYGSDYVNVLWPLQKEGKWYPTILLGGPESFNILLDEYRPRGMYPAVHELGHGLGLAVPEWYFYKYSDCTGVEPRFSDYNIEEDPYFQNDPMLSQIDDINAMQFSELNSAIINKNLNLEYNFEDVRKNWFSKITKIYVTDKSGKPVQGATVKIFPVKIACLYCSTECKGVEYGHGVPKNPSPEQVLTTDKNGYVTYDGPVGAWQREETENTPVIVKAIKVYYGGKSATKVVNFLDLQKNYVLNNSNEHITHVILE